MSEFTVTEHVINGAHIREYARATADDQNTPLKLHIKQYTPKDNPSPRKGDVTIIGSHGNGFPKELYEPLWDSLHQHLAKQGIRIRDVWIADCAWQGQSGVLNQQDGVLGNDPGWFDYSRDMIHMANTFRMPRPLVAIGHSFGANALTHAALLHPRLFHTMVLLDAVIVHSPATNGTVHASASSRRRDAWPSRDTAAASFRNSPFYRSWDPRVLDLWIQHGLRAAQPHPPDPATDPDRDPDPQGQEKVTLTTSKHQEVFTFLRPSWPAFDPSGQTILHPQHIQDMSTTPPTLPPALSYPFYRPEPILTYDHLPHLRPSVLFLNGASSTVVSEHQAAIRASITGTARGGSGGPPTNRVRNVTHPQYGHLLPFEDPDYCAQQACSFLAAELAIWAADEADYQAWTRRPVLEKSTICGDWHVHLDSKGRHKSKM
ncbi:hypothetical protein E4U55_005432 [Claviceps digitariae]|nr:hypothetical protein E4U55_005432 [Claviceps digitariae]